MNLKSALEWADHYRKLKVAKMMDVHNQAALAVLADEVRKLQAKALPAPPEREEKGDER